MPRELECTVIRAHASSWSVEADSQSLLIVKTKPQPRPRPLKEPGGVSVPRLGLRGAALKEHHEGNNSPPVSVTFVQTCARAPMAQRPGVA